MPKTPRQLLCQSKTRRKPAALLKKLTPRRIILQAAHLLRQIPQMKREGTLDADNFAQQAEKFLEHSHYLARLSPDYKQSYEGFQKWFAAHNTTNKDFLDFEEHDLAPSNSGTASYFQKLHHDMDPIRERHLLNVIANAFRGHKHVLVVYGEGHWTKTRPVLEHMFGSTPCLDYK